MPTSYDETFNNHAIHEQLETLAEKLEELDASDLSKEDKGNVRRIHLVNAALTDWLERTDPAFVALSTLDNLNSYLSEINSQLTNYISNSNAGHITTSMASVDNILTSWHQLYAPRKTSDLQGITKSAISYRNAIENEVDKLKEKAEDDLSILTEEKETLEKRFEELTAELSESETEISKQKKRLDDAIAEFQQQFSTSQQTNRTEFEKEKKAHDKVETERQTKFDSLIKSGTERIKTIENDFNLQGDQFVLSLSDYQMQIDEMLGIVGEKVITNDYNERAVKEAGRAKVWLGITGFVFALLLGFALLIFWYVITDNEISYPRLISKLVVTAVLGFIAKWTIKQANRHQVEERRSHRLALALATISPYLKNLEPSQQNEIKTRLSDRLFGHIDDVTIGGKLDSSEESFTLLKSFTDIIHDLADVFQKKG